MCVCVYLQAHNLLPQLFRGSAGGISRQPDGRLEGHGDELLHLLCHGGAEQQGLPLLRSQLHNLLDLHSREDGADRVHARLHGVWENSNLPGVGSFSHRVI